MPKQTKKDIQELLLEQISLNRDLAQRLQDMEARMQSIANVNAPRAISPQPLPPSQVSAKIPTPLTGSSRQ